MLAEKNLSELFKSRKIQMRFWNPTNSSKCYNSGVILPTEETHQASKRKLCISSGITCSLNMQVRVMS